MVFDYIDTTICSFVLKIVQDSRKYIIKTNSYGLMSYDLKYYNLHEDYETIDKIRHRIKSPHYYRRIRNVLNYFEKMGK